MNHRCVQLSVVISLLVAGGACRKSNPLEPTSSTAGNSTSTGALTASVGAPSPVSPGNNVQIKFVDQPVTVVVANAVVTRGSGTTYMFELATDSGFANKVQTTNAVAEGGNGQTTLRLDNLAAAKDYYWHARAVGGGTTSVFGPIFKFSIGPSISINPPVQVSPLTGSTVGLRPILTATNATKTGPAGTITYRFEIADNPGFNPVTVTGTVGEGATLTLFATPADLTNNKTYFWRVTALDQANAISSPVSAVQSFTPFVPVGPPPTALWSGVQPPGTNGHAVLGDNWQTQNLVSFNGVPFTSPSLEQRQIFDLLDRGMGPQQAIDWMHANGYPTVGAYFPSVNVIGYPFTYMALINGRWDLVYRTGG